MLKSNRFHSRGSTFKNLLNPPLLVYSASNLGTKPRKLSIRSRKSRNYLTLVNRSTNATVRFVVKDVTRNAQIYFEALDLSIQTVDAGYKFSLYSESLCDLLLDPRMNVDQLRGFIQDLRGVARESHEAAKRTSEKFRLVRQGLNQITANLAPKIQGLQTTIQLPALMSVLQGQLQRATSE